MVSESIPKPRILIVEDEAIVAEDLSHKVTDFGYHVVGIVHTGEQAISVAQQSRVDLILLDLQLTGNLDGAQTAQAIHRLYDVAIVFITAHSDSDTVKKANATSHYGYILKPFGERDLAVQLTIALHRHRADRALKEEIAERQRAEHKLLKSEDLLLRAQRAAKAGVWEIDLRTERFTWSDPYYDLFGLNHSLQPSFDLWLSCIHPEDRTRIATEHKRSITEHSDQNLEFRIVKADGSVRWIQRQGKVEFNDQGEAIRIIGISLDITDRKQAEEALSAVALFPTQNPSPVLRVNAAGVLLFMNPASDRLLEELCLQTGQPVPQYLQDVVHQSLQTGRSEQFEYAIGSCHYLISITPILKEHYANLYWTDISDRKRAEQALQSSERRARAFLDNSAIIAWLKDEEGRNVFLSDNYVRRFGLRDWKDKTDFDLWPPDIAESFRKNDSLVLASGQPLEVIEQARMADGSASFWLNSKFWFAEASGRKFVGGVGVDITEHKQAEERLRESEERFRTLGDHMSQFAWMIDQSGDAVWFNRRWYEYTGTTFEQMRGWGWRKVHHPDHEERVVSSWRRALATGEPWDETFPLRGADGRYRWFLTRATPIQDVQGHTVRWFGTNTDITALRDAADALQESKERLRAIIETALDGIITIDESGTIQSINPAVERIFQYPKGELIGQNLNILMPEPDCSRHDGYLKRYRETGERKIIGIGREVLGRRKNGSLFPVELSISESRLPDKRFFTGILRDISARKQAEEALRESEERLRLANLATNEVIWDWDVAADTVLLNPSFHTLFGWSDSSPVPAAWWVERIHPEDHQRVTAHFFAVVQDHGITSWQDGYRFRKANGEYADVLDRGYVVRRADGTPSRMIGAMMDITKSKRREQRIAEQARLLDLTHDAIMTRDGDGRIHYWNQGATQLYGWTADEVRGRVGHDVLGTQFPEPLDSIQEQLRTDGSWSGEVVQRRKNGERVVTFSRWVLDHAENGHKRMVLETNHDITVRKQAEEELKESDNRLRLSLAAGQMGCWDVDLISGETKWDEKEYQLLGYEGHTVTASAEAFYSRVLQKDRARVKQAVGLAIAGSGELANEFRILLPNGEVRWLRSRGVVLKDNDGRPARIVGINYDMTERKHVEEEMYLFARELEVRVDDRTRELTASRDQLRSLAHELTLAEHRERKRLAAELHDHLQQMLVLGKLKLGQCKKLPSPVPAYGPMIQQVDDVLSDALKYSRTLVAELSPPVLRNHGLSAGLIWLAEYMKRHDLEVTIKVQPEDHALTLPEDQTVLLFQSVRELLMNAWKHAGTGKADVIVGRRPGELFIEVRDQGKGFNPAASSDVQESVSGPSSKFGLLSIKERMTALGGSFVVASTVGQGTTATIRLPLRHELRGPVEESTPGQSSEQPNTTEVRAEHDTA